MLSVHGKAGTQKEGRIRSTSQAALANFIYQFSFSYREYKFPTKRFQSNFTPVYLSIRPCSVQCHILNTVRNFFILILRKF